MPFETQLAVAAIILVFAFFMVLLAWAERRAGGSFEVGAREVDALGAQPAKQAGESGERRAA